MTILKIFTIAAAMLFGPGEPLGPCQDGECNKGAVCERSDVAWVCAPDCETTADCEAAFPGLNVDCTGAGECWVFCDDAADCQPGAICTEKGLCMHPG